jgi:membrane protein DedA with SNARE-associated domain
VSAHPLPGLLAHLAPLLDHYGYLAVAGFVALEDFGIPVPGETILVAAAVYAGAGRLNIWAVAVIAIVAAIIGDNIGYAIGRFGGRALVLRLGRYVRLTSERLDKAEGFFRRYGGIVVTVARFIEGLRQANGIVAGISRMPWPKFLAFNALGATLWAGSWSLIGYLAGDHITAIYNAVTRYGLYLLIALGAGVAALIIRAVVRRRRRARGLTRRLGDSALVLVGPGVERQHIGVGARRRAPSARPLPVRLLAQQGLTEPVELGDDLLRRGGDRLLGAFAQLIDLARHFELELRGNLVLRQGAQLLLRLAHRGPKVLGRGVGLADHLAALAHRHFQTLEFAHGILLARRPGFASVPVSAASRSARNAVTCRDAVRRQPHAAFAGCEGVWGR